MMRAFRRLQSLRCFANPSATSRCSKQDSGKIRKSLAVITQMSRSDIIMAALVGLGGVATFVAAQAQQFPEGPPCPTSQLAPLGIVPTGAEDHCSSNGCLVSFSGYKWWTAFNFVGPFHSEYYYNGGLRTIFAPEHVFADSQGLHLVVNNDANVGDPKYLPNKPYSGAEAVAMFKDDGNEANFGYGDYLVTATSSTPWNVLDPNVAVGMFTYERYGPVPKGVGNWPTFGGDDNPNREIDLAEISRWGWNHTGTCPIGGNDGQFRNRILCNGNAQFATQLVKKSEISVQRYDVGLNVIEITLVMQWRQGQATFFKFNGGNIHLGALPTTPVMTWTTEAQARNNTEPVYTDGSFHVTTPNESAKFIPDPTKVIPNPANSPAPTQSCARFHLNAWLGNYRGQRQPFCPGCNPGPTDNTRKEVVITNFEYAPLQ